jgi:hypothetical protein
MASFDHCFEPGPSEISGFSERGILSPKRNEEQLDDGRTVYSQAMDHANRTRYIVVWDKGYPYM